MTHFAKLTFLFLTCFATSCALLPQQPSSQNQANSVPQTTKASTPRVTSSFEKETLYDLLVAEFANKRGRQDLALGYYQKQAHITKDAQVTARATQIAQQIGAQQAILDTSMLWIEIDPKSIHARVTATLQLLRYKQFDKALDQVEALLDLSPTLNYEQLLRDTARADNDQRTQIIKRLGELSAAHPKNSQLWVVKAILENINNVMTDASQSINSALLINPGYTNAILFNSALLLKLGKHQEALTYLEQQSADYPLDRKLGIAYSKALANRKDHPKLTSQLKALAKNFPNDATILLATAQIAQSNSLTSLAKSHLHLMVEKNLRSVEAYSFLARIAVLEKDLESAIEYLRNIRPGVGYSTAQIQIASIQQQQGNIQAAQKTLHTARSLAPKDDTNFYLAEAELLTKNNQHQDSINTLNVVLDKNPKAFNALYMRAMVYAELQQFDIMERDLRIVINQQPDNSAALNALGYTLADRNDRLEEAARLIEKAYALSPNDPAIIDSLGWLKYRTGDNESALNLLKKAYILFQDQEIAAHLGELLWVTGNKDEAKTIWQNGLKAKPDSKVIQEAIERLMPTS
ncbi:hypothetical protein A9Q81_09540 [Gammaproteobacteria bacterium 42_54_T18]|nr:hypothetical protein A9Q81_09540 [Gammaproteobacteria bacterium 42_54_T18]